MIKCKKCGGQNCTCKKSINDLAKANPNISYNQLYKIKEDFNYQKGNGKVVIDDTNECESCQ